MTDRVTRRGFLAGASASAALLGLTACGGSSAATSSPATRVLDTAKGRVRVPRNPRRVLCADFVTTGAMYDLGVRPVGVDGKSSQYLLPAALHKFADISKISSTSGDLDLEAIARAKPDLILCTTLSEAHYSVLAKIAPTVVFTYAKAGGNWEKLEGQLADAVGRARQLRAVRAHYESTASTIKARYAAQLAGYRWDLVDGDPGTWYQYSPLSSHGAVLSRAGARFAASAMAIKAGFRSMSYENIDVLNEASAIGVGMTNTGAAAAGTVQLLKQPAFAALPAQRAGRVFHLYPFFPVTYGAATALLGQLQKALTDL